MVSQVYAPLVFDSLSQLETAVAGTRGESSYVLASARMPQALLQTRVMGKFHLFGRQDVPNLDTLAQLEFVDVKTDDLLEMYKQSALDFGYGRISLVQKGGMASDLSMFVDLFGRLGVQAEKLAGVADAEKQVDREAIVAWLKQLWGLQGTIHELSGLRGSNGFSAFENSAYGKIVMACYDFSALIQSEITNISEVFKNMPEGAFRLAQLAQAIDTRQVRAEVESEHGLNAAVYFSPRVDPEVAERVV